LLENDAEFFKKNFGIENPKRLGLEAGEVLDDNYWKRVYHEIKNVLIAVTGKCNANCNVCLTSDYKWQEPSIEEIESVVKKFKNKTIELTGGEPTLRKDLPEIIRTIKKTKNRASIFTNGIKTADKEYLNKLVEAGLDEVMLSFDSFDKNFMDNVKGGSYILPLKLKTLKNLEEKKVSTKILVTYFPGYNEDFFKKIYNLAIKKAFIKNVSVHTAYPFSGKFKLKMDYVPTLSDALKLVTQKTGLSSELFLETRRLKVKIRKLLRKIIGKKSDVLADDIYLSTVVDKKGKPVLNIQDLKTLEELMKGNVKSVKSLNKTIITSSLNLLIKGFNSSNLRDLINTFKGTEVRVGLCKSPPTFHAGNVFNGVIWSKRGNIILPRFGPDMS
jgi:MoaA/NifB/PqqE/SkfB family radical SAM enzyme